jgi:hypothetical protein
MKYRFILPGAYILLILAFILLFLKGAGGHGWNPFEFVFYLTYPAAFLLEVLPASWGPEDDLVLSLLFGLVGLIQWALVGYVLDKLLARPKQNETGA